MWMSDCNLSKWSYSHIDRKEQCGFMIEFLNRKLYTIGTKFISSKTVETNNYFLCDYIRYYPHLSASNCPKSQKDCILSFRKYADNHLR